MTTSRTREPFVIFLCGRDELDKERRGYASAFERIGRLQFIAPSDDWQAALGGRSPTVVINPDGKPWLPVGIERAPFPTAVFHIDTFAGTPRRIQSARMYDHVFVFHPGFEDVFRAAGIPGVRLLPHAAERDLFQYPEGKRRYEVGWVGRVGHSFHSSRDRILAGLSSRFTMNDLGRYYSPEEMAAVYQASKVVVNVSRDDYPQDANMRCFEAMAGGALLVTRVPSELASIGFLENVHFAGYRDDQEVSDVVAHWLQRENERAAIAQRARELVLREHTYDARVLTILAAVGKGADAQARTWSRGRAEALRFQYHVEQADTAHALQTFAHLTVESPLLALRYSLRLLRLGGKLVRRALRR